MPPRLFVLRAPSRNPLDFPAEALGAAATGWKGLNAALSLGDRHGESLGWSTAAPLREGAMTADGGPADTALVELEQRFISAMDDDLNSSGGLAVLFDLAKPLRALANRLERGEDAALPEQELKGLEGRW